MRSAASHIVEWLLPLTGIKRGFASEAALRRWAQASRRKGPALPSRWIRRQVAVAERTFNASRVFTLAPKGGSSHVHILYLHGGAYVLDIAGAHWKFVAWLVRSTLCRAIVPLYPLAPEHDWRHVFDLLVPLAAQAIAEHGQENVIFMGDSAGGGMALSLAQRLRDIGRPQPARLILISPSLDLTFSDPQQAELARIDPVLDLPGVIAAAGWYAGDLSPADPKISPLFDSIVGMPPIAVFTGTRDLLNPDAHRLQAKAAQHDVPLALYERRGMVHVWPLFPIPEARLAKEQMKFLIWDTPP
jgi:epsilon-lactone hydrolase